MPGSVEDHVCCFCQYSNVAAWHHQTLTQESNMTKSHYLEFNRSSILTNCDQQSEQILPSSKSFILDFFILFSFSVDKSQV